MNYILRLFNFEQVGDEIIIVVVLKHFIVTIEIEPFQNTVLLKKMFSTNFLFVEYLSE